MVIFKKFLKYGIYTNCCVYGYSYYDNRFSLTKLYSQLFGETAWLYIPQSLRSFLFGQYSSLYGVNLDESIKKMEEFENFEQFFTRKIKDRKIDDCLFVSPADSQILSISEITEDEVLIVKNKKYNLGSLIYGPEKEKLTMKEVDQLKQNSDNKLYSIVFYLSPGDYHRFHSPANFEILEWIYIPGFLQRVDENSLVRNPKIYQTNERVNLIGKTKQGNLYMSIVGAMNVGKIELNFDKVILSNVFLKPLNIERKKYEKQEVRIGEEMGKFNLGSTIVLIIEMDKNHKLDIREGQKITYGTSMVATDNQYDKDERINYSILGLSFYKNWLVLWLS